jgi:hypothetical protein
MSKMNLYFVVFKVNLINNLEWWVDNFRPIHVCIEKRMLSTLKKWKMNNCIRGIHQILKVFGESFKISFIFENYVYPI